MKYWALLTLCIIYNGCGFKSMPKDKKNKYGGKTFIYNIEFVKLINDVMNYSNK